MASFGNFEVGAGYRYYMHEGDLSDILEDTHEVGVSAATQLGILTLGMGAYYDVTNEDWYFEARAATEFKINDMISLVPAIGIGYGLDYDWQLITDAGQLDGFTAVTLSLAAPIEVTKNITVTPYIAANLPIDALEDAGEDNQLYGGISVTIRF